MENKQEFIKALNTLLFSWGGDTPPEAIWAANELLDWVEIEFNVILKLRFGEEEEEENGEVMKEIIKL